MSIFLVTDRWIYSPSYSLLCAKILLVKDRYCLFIFFAASTHMPNDRQMDVFIIRILCCLSNRKMDIFSIHILRCLQTYFQWQRDRYSIYPHCLLPTGTSLLAGICSVGYIFFIHSLCCLQAHPWRQTEGYILYSDWLFSIRRSYYLHCFLWTDIWSPLGNMYLKQYLNVLKCTQENIQRISRQISYGQCSCFEIIFALSNQEPMVVIYNRSIPLHDGGILIMMYVNSYTKFTSWVTTINTKV